MIQSLKNQRKGPSSGRARSLSRAALIIIPILAAMTTRAWSTDESLEKWLTQEQSRAITYLMRNVSPPGEVPGAIIASPSRHDPDYYYHWVRDSGIAIRAILSLYTSASDQNDKQHYLTTLMDFVHFSKITQWTATHGGYGLGEARFTILGGPVPGPWGRPQDDGPAIRVIELTHLAMLFLEEGREAYVRAELYDGKLPTASVIKTDLEYLSHHWEETCYGPWEDERGHVFYTQLLERMALTEGAMLATRLGDLEAASWYLEQAELLGKALARHWDPKRHYLVDTLDWQAGVDYKTSNLDSSTVVATLGGYSTDDLHLEALYPVDNEQVEATALAVESAFRSLYPINDPARGVPGVAIGRYPEDRYNGHDSNSLGNPWPSLTIAFAMYYYKLCHRFATMGTIALSETSLPFFKNLHLRDVALAPHSIFRKEDPAFTVILRALREKADAFLSRVRFHTNRDGTLSEEINRDTGTAQGAPNLSMSYAALLLAVQLRGQQCIE